MFGLWVCILLHIKGALTVKEKHKSQMSTKHSGKYLDDNMCTILNTMQQKTLWCIFKSLCTAKTDKFVMLQC